MTPVKQAVSILEVEPSSPTPLLTDTDEMEKKEVPPPLNADISGSSISREEAVKEEEESENDGKSPYMPGNNLDDEEDETVSTADPGSGYESRNFCGGD